MGTDRYTGEEAIREMDHVIAELDRIRTELAARRNEINKRPHEYSIPGLLDGEGALRPRQRARARASGPGVAVSDQVVYEIFGTLKGDTPPTRIAGPGTFPPDEVHNDVASFTLRLYGDDITDGFLHVHGIDEDAVRAAWVAAAQFFRVQLRVIWGWSP